MSDIEVRRKREEAFDWVQKVAEEEVDLLKKELFATSLKVDFRCAKTKNEWTVVLRKEGNSSLFEVVGITTATTTPQSKSGASTVSRSTVVDLDMIKNRSSIRCPHCGEKRWVKCFCGKLSCEGGIEKRDEGTWHVCPWCREGGYIEGTFKTIDGEMEDKKRITGQKDKPSLPRPCKALPP